MGRLFETSEPHPGVFNLLCRKLSLLDEQAGGTGQSSVGRAAAALAFRLKLLLAAGLGAPARRVRVVRRARAPGRLLRRGRGWCVRACEAASFPLGEEAYRFMTEALGRPLTEAPDAPDPALGQVERAISATLEHHAHLRLMPAAAARAS